MTCDVRRGDWMQTFRGRQFWPLDPRADEVDIVDIAAALSKITRYGGHCLRFYSVAEHSVLMARAMIAQGGSDRLVRAALLHDASEAYLADIIRPIKPHLENYAAFEARLMNVIAQRFDFDWPLPVAVKALDEAILHDEQAQNMAAPPVPWNLPGDRLGVILQFWPPNVALAEFARMAARCGATP